MAVETVSPKTIPKLAAAAVLLAEIASRLDSARRLLAADDEGSSVDGARLLVELAGSLADDGAAALGEMRMSTAVEWLQTSRESASLETLKGIA